MASHHCCHTAQADFTSTHSHFSHLVGTKLHLAIILTLVFVVGEAVAGISSRSLALVSDAGHNLADVLSLAVTWVALRLQNRPPTPAKTFGLQRIGILSAFINSSSLLVIAAFIFWEGVERLLHPQAPDSRVMLVVASLSLLLNGAIALSLFRDSQTDLNLRSAFLHMAGDAVSALGILVSALVLRETGWVQIDAVVSLLIGLGLSWSSWSLLKESTHLLLEGTPQGICVATLQQDLHTLPTVRRVRHLHVWGLSPRTAAMCCHVEVAAAALAHPRHTLGQIEHLVRERYRITHTTIQLEGPDETAPVLSDSAPARLPA